MRLSIVGHQGDVRPTKHHRDLAPAEVIGKLVRPHRRARDHRHADQVGLKIQIDVGDPLVDASHYCDNIFRDQRR